MFKLNQTKTYWTPVTVEIPTDGGLFEKSTLDVCFKRLTRDELSDLQKSLNNLEINDLQFCKRVMADWKKVQDDEGQDIPFSDSTLSRVDHEVIQFAPAVVQAFFDSIVKVREKK